MIKTKSASYGSGGKIVIFGETFEEVENYAIETVNRIDMYRSPSRSVTMDYKSLNPESPYKFKARVTFYGLD
jgi:hypothetical protein